MGKKTGSNQIVQCLICGVYLTKAGMIGHMRYGHHRDHKAPLMPVEAQPYINKIQAKAKLYDNLELIERLKLADASEFSPCCKATLLNAFRIHGNAELSGAFVCEDCGKWYQQIPAVKDSKIVILSDGRKVKIGKPAYRPVEVMPASDVEKTPLHTEVLDYPVHAAIPGGSLNEPETKAEKETPLKVRKVLLAKHNVVVTVRESPGAESAENGPYYADDPELRETVEALNNVEEIPGSY